MRTLVVASVGSQVGLAILDAIDAIPERRAGLRIVGLNSEPDAAQNFRCDTTYLVPPTGAHGPYLDALRAIFSAVRPDGIFAGRDEDLEPLALLAEDGSFAATSFILPRLAAARATTDKYDSFRFAVAHDLPFAQTATTRAELDALIREHGFPLIAKPRRGAGSLDVYAVRRPAEAAAALASGRFVFQPFLDPPPAAALEALDPAFGQPVQFSLSGQNHYSATTVVGRGGQMLGLFMGRHHFRRGETDRIMVEEDPALAAALGQWAAALHQEGLVGPLNIQCRKIATGGFVPFELNARFTGSSAVRAQLGFDDVGAALDHFLWNRDPPPRRHAPSAFLQYRRTGTLVPASDVERLAREGVWQGPASLLPS